MLCIVFCSVGWDHLNLIFPVYLKLMRDFRPFSQKTLGRNFSIESVSDIEEMANLWLSAWTVRDVSLCLTISDRKNRFIVQRRYFLPRDDRNTIPAVGEVRCSSRSSSPIASENGLPTVPICGRNPSSVDRSRGGGQGDYGIQCKQGTDEVRRGMKWSREWCWKSLHGSGQNRDPNQPGEDPRRVRRSRRVK